MSAKTPRLDHPVQTGFPEQVRDVRRNATVLFSLARALREERPQLYGSLQQAREYVSVG
jgi:hypothetical protein